MKKLIVLAMALLMVMPTYGENYTPSQDAFQANDVPMDSSLPFDEEYKDDDEDPICPGEPMPEVEEVASLIPPIPLPQGPRPFPRPRPRRRRSLCIAQGNNQRDLYYSIGRNRREASRRARRRCRRETFRQCRLFWCGRVNN